MELEIRNYHPSDLVSIYNICLQTGDSGKDASHLFNDPNLLAHFYAAPYAVLEPELCFILTADKKPCGYILGTKDSENFASESDKKWFSILRPQYPIGEKYKSAMESRIVQLIHEGYKPKPELLNYPAHLHIDLLPVAQGKGMGRKMIDTFINKLRDLKIPALHLEVGKKNENAVLFYQKVGFEIIHEYEFSIVFGMRLE
ncbi:ribosomal-protein-alanine N-acetyltransferase [bacterium BMS3Abin04]|nr:ribosomal-protein-alanine N-acetyltransferase [bacterium BMS3Abin04]